MCWLQDRDFGANKSPGAPLIAHSMHRLSHIMMRNLGGKLSSMSRHAKSPRVLQAYSHLQLRPLCIYPPRTPDGVVRSKNWDDMAPATRELWAVLGWSSINWARGPNPPSDDLDWEELSEEEQQAASMLGYTEDTWDDESFGNPFNTSGGERAEWYDNPVVPLMGFGALVALVAWWDEQQWKRVGLSREQKDELRSLVTELDLPTPATYKGRQTWFRSATSSQKTEVANAFLRRLLNEFHIISAGKDRITREQWEHFERTYSPDAATSSATRAVCGAVFSRGGRGMRLVPSAASPAEGGLSFRTFATLCTLLASSSQGDVTSQARLVFFLADEDADGVISRAELRDFVATCLDANLLRPKAFHKQLMAKLSSTLSRCLI